MADWSEDAGRCGQCKVGFLVTLLPPSTVEEREEDVEIEEDVADSDGGICVRKLTYYPE